MMKYIDKSHVITEGLRKSFQGTDARWRTVSANLSACIELLIKFRLLEEHWA